MSGRWHTIESDPAVFTELIEKLGVKGISVEELFSGEAAELENFSTVYGLILLFKCKAASEAPVQGTVEKCAPVYFAKQSIPDACATLAVVNTLCNFADKIQLGTHLKNFFDFTQDLTPELRGKQIGESEVLREAHNSFAAFEFFSMEDKSDKDTDSYHFVSFIYRNGCIWELDGLQDGPILCGEANDHNYKDVLIHTLQRMMAEVAAKDVSGAGQGISFALMAVVDDPIPKMETLLLQRRAAQEPTGDLEESLERAKAQRERGRKENARRRHNYFPMIVALLKALAEKGKLKPIVEELREKKTNHNSNSQKEEA